MIGNSDFENIVSRETNSSILGPLLSNYQLKCRFLYRYRGSA